MRKRAWGIASRTVHDSDAVPAHHAQKLFPQVPNFPATPCIRAEGKKLTQPLALEPKQPAWPETGSKTLMQELPRRRREP